MSIFTYVRENKEKLILFSMLSCVLGIIFAFFYALTYILTTYGSLFLFSVFLSLIFHLCTRIATFPGAYIFWLRTIERSNLKSISSQTCKKLEILNVILLFIKDSNFEEIYERITFNTLKTIPKAFEKITKNLKSLKSEGLSEEQEFLVENFGKLINCLGEIKFVVKNNEKKDLYEFLLNPALYREIVFNNADSLKEAFLILDSLYMTLRAHLKDPESFKDLIKFFNYKLEVPLGSINYMRNDLIDKMGADNIWVTSEDGTKIDCLWIPGTSKYTVLYCHPNGGFYEFVSLQNEWIEFYKDLGFNVMLWNYRGYGRTQGNPSMKNLALDGEAVFKYVKEVKNSEKVLVHGQSLGGSVACRLGKVADFVFADRTFRALSDVALLSYGKIIFSIYKWFGPGDTDPVKDYLAAGCYKLVSCDPEDQMIPHLASLKSGIILSLTQISECKGKKVYNLIKEYKKNPNFSDLLKDLNEVKRLKHSKDEESPKFDIIGTLCSLSIFGRNLYKISKKKNIELELILWVLSIKVWKEVDKEIRVGIDEAEKGLTECEDCDEGRVMKRILFNLKEIIEMEELDIIEDFHNAGKILTLHCGHNNAFQPYELHIYKSHLKAANMMPK